MLLRRLYATWQLRSSSHEFHLSIDKWMWWVYNKDRMLQRWYKYTTLRVKMKRRSLAISIFNLFCKLCIRCYFYLLNMFAMSVWAQYWDSLELYIKFLIWIFLLRPLNDGLPIRCDSRGWSVFLALAAKITANTSKFLIRWISKLF